MLQCQGRGYVHLSPFSRFQFVFKMAWVVWGFFYKVRVSFEDVVKLGTCGAHLFALLSASCSCQSFSFLEGRTLGCPYPHLLAFTHYGSSWT